MSPAVTILTCRLRDYPYAVLPALAQEPLRIDVLGGDTANEAMAHSFRMRGERTATLRALDRVAWARIDRDAGRHVVTISRTHGELEEAEPCYYLPWIRDHTLGMKLRPSQKIADDGRFAAYNENDHVDEAVLARATAQRDMLRAIEDDEERAPRLFFTATLTGCSVHIEGDPTQPNVYHGNADRLTGADGGVLVADMTTRTAYRNRMGEIDAYLRQEYQGIPWAHGGANVSLGACDYDFRMWDHPALAPKWGRGRNLLTRQLREAGGVVRAMNAVVFGTRRRGNNEWIFYGQRVYQYQVTFVNGMMPGANFGYLGYPPRQIWPGPGHIQL